MRNAYLLSAASAVKRLAYDGNVVSEHSSVFFVFVKENSILSALRNGSLDLSSFIESTKKYGIAYFKIALKIFSGAANSGRNCLNSLIYSKIFCWSIC
jgi:hypothetical protein